MYMYKNVLLTRYKTSSGVRTFPSSSNLKAMRQKEMAKQSHFQ